MIENILTRRKESDTYLDTVSRHRWSLQIAMKVDKMCSFQPTLWRSSAELIWISGKHLQRPLWGFRLTDHNQRIFLTKRSPETYDLGSVQTKMLRLKYIMYYFEGLRGKGTCVCLMDVGLGRMKEHWYGLWSYMSIWWFGTIELIKELISWTWQF